jgi:transposase
MKAYSLDLRRRIIETDRTEMITRKGLAARFKVSESFVGQIDLKLVSMGMEQEVI